VCVLDENVVWHIQDLQFSSDLYVLSLDNFDTILGYNYLQQFSPMKIQRGAKWLIIPYGSVQVMLHGIMSKLKVGDVVQIYQFFDQDLNLDDSEPSL
jgi:hypothetical protein